MAFSKSHIVAAASIAASAIAGGANVAGCSKAPDTASPVGASAIVFLKRQHTVTNGAVTTVNVAGGNGQVLDYERYVPGGSLNLLTPPRPDGQLQNLTQDFATADFNGVDVAFDARQVVFSMKKDPADHYHLYTAQLARGADGKFEIHQLTAGDYDDINPVYLAAGRIAFVTNQMYTEMGTRADEYEHSRGATQLATITVSGGDADRRLMSQNLSHTVAPFSRADGRIGYSRWEHLGPINDVKLFAANPDGTGMVGVAGQGSKPSTALFSVREVQPNVMIGIATARNRTIHAGALIKIDARNQAEPACKNPTDDQFGKACLDEERATYEVLTPDVPLGNGPSPVGRYRSPAVLPDGRYLVSYAEGPVNDQAEGSATPPDFGIYVFDAATKRNQLVYNTVDAWEVNALPIVVRKEPPALADIASASADTQQPVRLGSVDISVTNLKEKVSGGAFQDTDIASALKTAAKVRIIEGFSSEGAPGVSMFGLTMDEGAAILGEAKVESDGSWLADIPPYLPVHLQPLDKWGMSIRNQRLWIQGMPGEDRRCVGCHEDRVAAGKGRSPNPTVAEQRGAERFMAAVGDRVEFPWTQAVQPLLDAKCASCHSGGAGDPFAGKSYSLTRTDATGASATYRIPYLDLSAKAVAVYYDRRVASYPVSYASLFYPAAMLMGMGNTTVTGDTPPLWAVPSSARTSKLIEKLNLQAADGTFAFGKAAMHPEDKGVSLTAEERQSLVRVIDLGGQFYARKGSTFVPNTKDPVGKKP
jgi:Hydrazine synthase alpha subunit middle domain